MKSANIELVIPADRLPADPHDRDQLLQSYFADRVADSRQEPGGQWRITIKPPPAADFYIDPRLNDGLRWWSMTDSVTDIPCSYRRDNGIFTALSDAWTLLSWSQWLITLPIPPDRVTIIHLDDHDDLMSPRLAQHTDGFTDLLTGANVTLTDPATVKDAITSGAIGMGSFIVPLVHTVPSVDIRHLCDTHYATVRSHKHELLRVTAPDTLLRPGLPRPAVALSPSTAHGPPHGQAVGTYQAGHDPGNLFADMTDDPILLHIDLDFFNNRFNGNSAWLDQANRHDPSPEQIHERVDSVLAALAPLRSRIADITIGISAGFFPAEFWQPVHEMLARELAVGCDPVENSRL